MPVGVNFVVRPVGQVPVPNDMQALPTGVASWVCATIAMPENTVFQVSVGLTKAKVIEDVLPAPIASAPTNILELEATLERVPKSKDPACPVTGAVVGGL